MADQSGGPYSPDGRFWWDGAAWQPVQAPPPPGPPPQHHPAPPQPSDHAAGRPPTQWPPQPPGPQPPWPQAGQAYEAQPGQQYAAQPQSPPYHPGPSGLQSPPPAPEVSRRRPGTAVFALLAAGALIVALALGGVTGAALGMVVNDPRTNDPAPSFPATFPTGK
uniref:hypothetical protein n=1 Tax=Nonomuraea pusilla TaxID=46177 RepID=UPI000A985FF2|nr:hypothetical protein [Nonomuraea pusilla]